MKKQRRRRRRNPTWAAKGGKPYPRLKDVRENPGKYVYVCTLVNPKDHRPVQIVYYEGQGCRIGSPVDDPALFQTAGRGYYGVDDVPTDATGCPRSHTPGGVSVKGQGLGLMLYCGMAMVVAYAVATEGDRYGLEPIWSVIEDSGSDSGGCISSQPGDRSSTAADFWARATENGIAEEGAGAGEVCETVERDFPLTCHSEIDGYDVEQYFEDEYDSIHDAGGEEFEADGTIEVSFTGCKIAEANVLLAESVFQNGLVLHANPAFEEWVDYHLRRHVQTKPPAEVLLGLDCRGVRSVSFLAYLMDLLIQSGAGWGQIRKWRARNVPAWFQGDPDSYKPHPDDPYGVSWRQNRAAVPRALGPIKQTRAWQAYFGGLATGDWG